MDILNFENVLHRSGYKFVIEENGLVHSQVNMGASYTVTDTTNRLLFKARSSFICKLSLNIVTTFLGYFLMILFKRRLALRLIDLTEEDAEAFRIKKFGVLHLAF